MLNSVCVTHKPVQQTDLLSLRHSGRWVPLLAYHSVLRDNLNSGASRCRRTCHRCHALWGGGPAPALLLVAQGEKGAIASQRLLSVMTG